MWLHFTLITLEEEHFSKIIILKIFKKKCSFIILWQLQWLILWLLDPLKRIYKKWWILTNRSDIKYGKLITKLIWNWWILLIGCLLNPQDYLKMIWCNILVITNGIMFLLLLASWSHISTTVFLHGKLLIFFHSLLQPSQVFFSSA